MLPETAEASKATCFVLSVLSITLKPPVFVTTASAVTELNPLNVVILPPRATPVPPIVIELLASWELGIALVPNSPVLEL